MTITPKTWTIYGLLHRESGRWYVGQTINPKRREKDYRDRAHKSPSMSICQAIMQHGFGAFDWVILETTSAQTQAEADIRERWHSEQKNSRVPHGFNMIECGQGNGSRIGPRQEIDFWKRVGGKLVVPYGSFAAQSLRRKLTAYERACLNMYCLFKRHGISMTYEQFLVYDEMCLAGGDRQNESYVRRRGVKLTPLHRQALRDARIPVPEFIDGERVVPRQFPAGKIKTERDWWNKVLYHRRWRLGVNPTIEEQIVIDQLNIQGREKGYEKSKWQFPDTALDNPSGEMRKVITKQFKRHRQLESEWCLWCARKYQQEYQARYNQKKKTGQ